MNSFEYASPTDLEGAIGLLEGKFGDVEILAGGTDLVTSLKQGIVSPKRLVSLKAIPALKGIEAGADAVHIGAMTPLVDVLEHAAIKKSFPSITTAIEGIGSPQIIAMGTAGGDLCQRPRCWYYRQGFGLLGQLDGESLIPNGDNRYHAILGNSGPAYFVSPSSLGPPLVALGATIDIAGPKGKNRQVPASEFFRVPQGPEERENVLAANEVVARISIPLRGLANATYEIRQREGLDWPLVTASVAFARGGGRAKGGAARDRLGSCRADALARARGRCAAFRQGGGFRGGRPRRIGCGAQRPAAQQERLQGSVGPNGCQACDPRGGRATGGLSHVGQTCVSQPCVKHRRAQ